MKHRQPELEQYRMIWLTKESYTILRKEKKKQKKSMAKLNDEAIINQYK